MKRAVFLSILDQALISAFSLALNLAFIALADPAEFGRFIFIQAIVFFALSAQNALVIMPLNYLLPGRPEAEADAKLSMLTSIMALLTLAMAPLAIGVALLVAADPMLLVAIVAFFLSMLAREYSRNLQIVRGAVAAALLTDGLMIIASMIFVTLFWVMLSPEAAALLGMSCGNIVGLLASRQDFRLAPRLLASHIGAYRAVWKETRWALQGALQNEVEARSYVFLLERVRDAAVLGTVQAGRVALSPLFLITNAWRRIARPRMVADLHEGETCRVGKTMMAGLLVSGGATLAYGVGVLVLWPVFEMVVFRGRYENIEVIVLSWWFYALAVGLAGVPATVLEATRSFRALAFTGLAVAILVLAGQIGVLLTPLDVSAIILSMAAIHAGEFIFYCVLIRSKLAAASGEPKEGLA